MKNYIIIILLVFGISSCENNSIIEGHEHDHEAHGAKGAVELTEKQLSLIDFELGDFQQMNLGKNIKCSGELELPPQNKASVSALLGGRVKSIDVMEGNFVKKGQTLAVLEHPDVIEYQEQYLDVANNISVLKSDFERKQALFNDSITSQKVFEQAESDYLSAVAKLNTLKAKLSLIGVSANQVEQGNISSGITIKSPIDGYVRLVEINIGKFVEPASEMFEIVDNEHIHIDLHVYEKDINAIKIGQKVLFSLASNEGVDYEAVVFAIGKAFENDTKSVRVHAEIIAKKHNLLPGMYVNAIIVTDPQTRRVLPDNSIISEGEHEYIFVQTIQKEDDHEAHGHEEHGHEEHGHEGHGHNAAKVGFLKIGVSTGNSELGFTEIIATDSLPLNEGIVIKGAFYLHAEMKKGDAGHVH
jgi:cobalt-zinc-cadmium efflux system membrane fusion protein